MRTPTIHTPTELQDWSNGEEYEGGYRPARCLGWELSVFHPRRWKIAWRVFIGRYDALDWEAAKLLDLAAAGWLKKLTHIWASPTGKLYLGPAGAWKVMRGLPGGCEVTVRTITERP